MQPPVTNSTNWTPDDTRIWIHTVYLKLEAYHSYLQDLVEWCEANEITSEKTIMVLSMMTILWTGYQLGEPVSRQQMFEIMGVDGWECVEDNLLTLPPKYGELELSDLLAHAVANEPEF